MLLDGCYFGYYQLLHQINSGRMGTIYLAQDTHLPRQVAIKVVRAEDEAAWSKSAETTQHTMQLFLREMHTIAQLDHPHILPIFDSGEAKIHAATYLYFVMPYRPEGSLADWLRQREKGQRLSVQEVSALLSQAALALQYAHDHNIVHQDVKPSNFLLRAHASADETMQNVPDLLLMDFGLAHILTTASSMSQGLGGTPFYMAPEQWDGKPVPASDQYALAVMAFQLLTGQFPFQGGASQVMYQHHVAQPPTPSSLNPHLSPALDAIIIRALAKQAQERFPSIKDFAKAFAQEAQKLEQSPHPLPEQDMALEQPTSITLEQMSTLILPKRETLSLAAQAEQLSPTFPTLQPASPAPIHLQASLDRSLTHKARQRRLTGSLIGLVALVLCISSGILLYNTNFRPSLHNNRLTSASQPSLTTGTNQNTNNGIVTTIPIHATSGTNGQPSSPSAAPSTPTVPPDNTPTPSSTPVTPAPTPTVQPACSTTTLTVPLPPILGPNTVNSSNLVTSSTCNDTVLVNLPQIPLYLTNVTIIACVEGGSCGSAVPITTAKTWFRLNPSMPSHTTFWLKISYNNIARNHFSSNLSMSVDC